MSLRVSDIFENENPTFFAAIEFKYECRFFIAIAENINEWFLIHITIDTIFC